MVIGLFKSIFLLLSCDSSCFSRDGPFYLTCQICACRVICSISFFLCLQSLYWYFCFTPDIGSLCLLSFVSLARSLSILLIFSKNQLFVSLIWLFFCFQASFFLSLCLPRGWGVLALKQSPDTWSSESGDMEVRMREKWTQMGNKKGNTQLAGTTQIILIVWVLGLLLVY